MRSIVVLAALGAASCSRSDAARVDIDGSAPIVSASAMPAADAARRENRVATFVGYSDYQTAFAAARPEMSDGPHLDGGTDAGVLLFAAWASVQMKWSDVAVAKDETTYALVLKDTGEAIGKRLCASGRIDAISALNMPAPARKVFVAYVRRTDAVFELYAARSTGALVKNDVARLCGVVVGRHAREGDPQFPAVALVGMFDLPENRGSGE